MEIVLRGLVVVSKKIHLPAKGLVSINPSAYCRGFTLIEMVVFIVVISVALSSTLLLFNQSTVQSVEPISQSRALQCAKAKLEEISLRKYSGSSPTGGIPACGSGQTGAVACEGIGASTEFDDIGDYHNQIDTSLTNCSITVTVSQANSDLSVGGLNSAHVVLRRIDVEASSGKSIIKLSSYRGNY